MFTMSSFIIIGIAIVIGIVLALVVQITWVTRILIASYIAISLVFFMPDYFIFSAYASIVYFVGIVIIFVFIEGSRFFDMSERSVGRFSFEAIGFSILTIFLLFSIMCLLLPQVQLNFFITRELYDFSNKYIFYIAIAPPIFSILFSRR